MIKNVNKWVSELFCTKISRFLNTFIILMDRFKRYRQINCKLLFTVRHLSLELLQTNDSYFTNTSNS